MVLSLSLNLLSRALALLLLLFGTARESLSGLRPSPAPSRFSLLSVFLAAEGRRVSLEDLPSFLAELGKLTSGRKSARAPQV